MNGSKIIVLVMLAARVALASVIATYVACSEATHVEEPSAQVCPDEPARM